MTITSTNTPPGDGAAADGRRRTRPAGGLASQRRGHLVKLAAELFAEKGFQATTVRNIAEEAGILSGSLYHHFDSKESIVDEILNGFFDDLITADQAVLARGDSPRETISALIRVAFGTLEPHRAAITVLQNDWNYLKAMPRFDYLIKAEEEVETMWVTTMEEGRRQGLFRADLDPRLTYRMIRDTVWVAVRWFRPGGRIDAESLSDHYIGVLFDGISAR